MTTDDSLSRQGFTATGWPARRHGPPGNGVRRTEDAGRDDTTRYLCAAAHLDDGFADGAVKEYLVEPTRPVPDSPGLDAAAVLAEAVAARTRRKIRDIALIVLMLGFLFLAAIPVLVGWIVLACLISAPAAMTVVRKRMPYSKIAYAGAALVGLLVVVFVLWPMVQELENNGSGSYNSYGESTSDGLLLGAVVVVLAMLSVLFADRITVWRHLDNRFWPNRRTPVTPWVHDRQLFGFSPHKQLAQWSARHSTTTSSAPATSRGTASPRSTSRRRSSPRRPGCACAPE